MRTTGALWRCTSNGRSSLPAKAPFEVLGVSTHPSMHLYPAQPTKCTCTQIGLSCAVQAVPMPNLLLVLAVLFASEPNLVPVTGPIRTWNLEPAIRHEMAPGVHIIHLPPRSMGLWGVANTAKVPNLSYYYMDHRTWHTLASVQAGDQAALRMSRQISPVCEHWNSIKGFASLHLSIVGSPRQCLRSPQFLARHEPQAFFNCRMAEKPVTKQAAE
jgi:hypothetical protein